MNILGFFPPGGGYWEGVLYTVSITLLVCERLAFSEVKNVSYFKRSQKKNVNRVGSIGQIVGRNNKCDCRVQITSGIFICLWDICEAQEICCIYVKGEPFG